MKLSFFSFVFYSHFFLFQMFSNPHGHSVAQGNASVATSNGLVEVIAADKAVIDWAHFSIEKGEITRFIQPGQWAAVLNRVKGLTPSQIDGLLEANGCVFLLNPNGVFIGKEGVVRAAEFAASTQEIAELTNWVENFHSSLHLAGNGIVNHEGLIQATGFSVEGGKVILTGSSTQVAGRIEAHEVVLLGNEVMLLDGSHIEAPGGNVYIGGDFQGSNPEFLNAKVVALAPDAHIRLDAGTYGDGGQAILWSDERTIAYGTISARGGDMSGDGGFVEVSSKGILDFHGIVDRRAPFGKAGELLLDPSDITISTAVSAPAFPTSPGFYDPPGAMGTLNDGDLTTGLSMGPVTVQTLSGVGGAGNITVAAGVSVTMVNNLTLIANNDINFTPAGTGITFGGSGNLNMTALGGSITIGSAAATATTSLTTSGDIDIQASTGFTILAPMAMNNTTHIYSSSATGAVDINVSNGNFLMDQQNAGETRVAIGIEPVSEAPVSGPVTITTPNGGITMQTASNTRGCFIGSQDRVHLIASQDVVMRAIDTPFAGADPINLIVNSLTGNPTLVQSTQGSIVFDLFNPQVTWSITNSSLNMNAALDWIIQNPGSGGPTSIQVQGDINAQIGRDILFSYSGATVSILGINSTDGNINFSAGGNVSMQGTVSGPLVVLADIGETTITAGGNVDLGNTNPAANNCASFSGGAGLTIDADGSITVGQGGKLLSGDDGFIFAKANQNISLLNDGSIDAFSVAGSCAATAPKTGFSVTLVVDDQAPAPPQIGSGQFIMDPSAAIITVGTAPVQIFTAQPTQNSISGLINGSAFNAGPFGVDTDTEHWGIWYPDAFVNPNSPFYTIFYKIVGAQTPPISQAIAAIFGEVFQSEFGAMGYAYTDFFPPPFYDDHFKTHFCYSYPQGNGKLWIQALPKENWNWIQVDNYRKFYLSRNKFIHIGPSESYFDPDCQK